LANVETTENDEGQGAQVTGMSVTVRIPGSADMAVESAVAERLDTFGPEAEFGGMGVRAQLLVDHRWSGRARLLARDSVGL
jgi:hypothetical protein